MNAFVTSSCGVRLISYLYQEDGRRFTRDTEVAIGLERCLCSRN